MNHGERTSHLTTQYNYAVVEVELELWERSGLERERERLIDLGVICMKLSEKVVKH